MGVAQRRRRLPVGAEPLPEGGVHFRVWAPRRRQVQVAFEGQRGASPLELAPEGNGYFSGELSVAGPGTLYRYRLDLEEPLYPDPASRFQPDGPHGPSQVVDPSQFRWSDDRWPGVSLRGQVIYELHIGTFTREGSWEAASRELPELAALGVTLVEVMPVAEFPGRFGWGYDGVDLYAPTRLYGSPDDFRRFVDRAHAAGLGVILDVVYNHLGPDGNYLPQFSQDYFTDRHSNEWGEALNFDGPNSGPVREFFVANAGYWIEEFHLDGLRLDATQTIHDQSSEHILAAIARHARQMAAGRSIVLVAENEPQQVRLVQPPEQGGYGLDGLWDDDFHHSAMVAVTGRNEAYYMDYLGTPQELVSAIKYGFLYQGQSYRWQRKRRGNPTFGLDPAIFVLYMQNHDQVANSAAGLRVDRLTSPGRHRAITALMLLAPGTPMLFQGQEFSSSSPFAFFADHPSELARLVRQGRREFVAQFPSVADPEILARLYDPADPATFQRCKLDLTERESHAEAFALHRDLLRLRKEDPAFRLQQTGRVDGAVLGPEAFLIRFFGNGGDDRLLLVNLGRDLRLNPLPEPLLAPPEGVDWELLWSSESPRYGGLGTPPMSDEEGLHVPSHAALVLRPSARSDRRSSGGVERG